MVDAVGVRKRKREKRKEKKSKSVAVPRNLWQEGVSAFPKTSALLGFHHEIV